MVLFICSDIYSICCFPSGAFGLSGFPGSVRFGAFFDGIFSSVSIIKYLRSWRGQGNYREIKTDFHKLTGFPNPPFLLSRLAAWKSKTTSAGAGSDFQAENSGILEF